MLFRSLCFTPLLFITLILLFTLYAFLTLLFHLSSAGEYVRASAYAVCFGWLWAGTAGGVGMAWWVGGGRVRGDERGSVRGDEGGRVRGDEGREEGKEPLLARGGEEEVMRELEQGGREERVQVKSGGGGRFCRKVSALAQVRVDDGWS